MTHRLTLRIAALAGWLSAFWLPPLAAQAQMYYDGPAYHAPVPNLVGPAIVGQSMGSYIERGKTKAPPRGEPTWRAALQVGSDPAVSSRVKEDFRRQLVQANPNRRAAIERALTQDWLRGYRDEIARPNGLDPRNLADAVTAYTVAAWAIVHRQATIGPRAVASVRDSMRASLAVNPQLARLSPAARQRMAEELILHTVLIMANRTEIHRTGDRALAEAAARHYREAARQGMQVDLATLALTERGFESR
ncbi:DUF6683 family protein [Pseudorhodoferax sp.]|uniref:DUF6683 family protein n=1 Tax=Pseudorhodoferax sp. TaxID=1993553 RepID=UPI0039E51D07